MMKILQSLACLLSLTLTLPAASTTNNPVGPYSTWMLESIMSRGEGINPADGLLGVIQKGLFQEALRAAIRRSRDPAAIARWKQYHQQSVETNIERLLNATAASRHLSLDRLCIGRSVLEANLDGPIHRKVLKALRKSIDLQYRSQNNGLWYFVDPPPPYQQYGNLSYSDGMYAFAPFAALYGSTYGDSEVNLIEALHQLELLYHHSVQASTGLILHGYDASRNAPWADPVTGASPILWGRSLAWYLIGVIDTLEIIEDRSGSAAMETETVQRMLDLFQRLALATVRQLKRSASQTGRYAVWQVMDQPGSSGNFVEASASAMIAYVLLKATRLGYLTSTESNQNHASTLNTQKVMRPHNHVDRKSDALKVGQALYEDVQNHFVVQTDDNYLQFSGTSAIASLHEEQPNYGYYTHRAVTVNSLIGTSAFVLASLEMESVK